MNQKKASPPVKKTKIALVSAWDYNCQDLANYCWPNKVEYCKWHDYTPVGRIWTGTRHPVWARIDIARQVLAKHDILFVLDLDTWIFRLEFRLEKFITDHDLIVTHDINGLNIGAMFIRNTEWSHKFLETIWNAGERFASHPSTEQSTLAYMLYREPKEKWSCVPQKDFNAFHYAPHNISYPEGEYEPGDFLLHLPAMPNEMRIAIFKSYQQKQKETILSM